MPGISGVQKGASNPLYLDLQKVVSHYGGVRNPRAASAFSYRANSVASSPFFSSVLYRDLSYRSGWPQTHGKPSASVSWRLGMGHYSQNWCFFFFFKLYFAHAACVSVCMSAGQKRECSHIPWSWSKAAGYRHLAWELGLLCMRSAH